MWVPALLVGCTQDPRDPNDSVPAAPVESNEPLEASFGEDLTEGYHCGLPWYVLHDEDRTIRLQAALLPSLSDPHETGHLEQADATLGVGDDAATLRVYLGTCLMTPGCTDDPGPTPGCSEEQTLLHQYDAVAGEAHLEKNSDGTISGVVTGLVLQGHDDEPLVEVDELELLAVGEGER